jgi:predicted dehydrogenase
MILPRPGARPLAAPAPFATSGRIVVRRHHAFVPDALFASGAPWQSGTVQALRRRYPHALKKTVAYLRTEGLAQTWTKLRTRGTLARLEHARAAFAAVGTIVEAPQTAFLPETPVLCWSWQGPADADYHLVGPAQCLPIPDVSSHFASAPYLAWIANVIRHLEIDAAAIELRGFDQALLAPLIELAGGDTAHGVRVLVGCDARMDEGIGDGAIAIRLSAERSAAALVETTPAGRVCRLPDPAHYVLDPYYPGDVEFPWPFTRATVEEALAILAKHRPATPSAVSHAASSPPATMMALPLNPARPARVSAGAGVSNLGAGNYVRAVLLHHLRRYRKVDVCGVMDIRPEVAAIQGRALGARYCTTDPARVINDPDTDLVLIASDHASHADYAIAAIGGGKAVHLEKPPAVTPEQLNRLLRCLRATPAARLHLGYNRPYAPATKALVARLAPVTGSTAVTCRVRGYRLSRAHWYRWPNQGTRIAGNVVHWIDLGYRLCGRQQPVTVEVRIADGLASDPDAFELRVTFEDASTVDIQFSSDEDSTYGMREQIEVRKAGVTAMIDDFLTLTIDEDGRQSRLTFPRDKGHSANMAALATLRVDPARLQDLIRDLELTGAIQFAAERSLIDGGGLVKNLYF